MKFKLITADCDYTEKEVKYLSKLGFKFKEDGDLYTIQKSPHIELNSLEELVQFTNDVKSNIKRTKGIILDTKRKVNKIMIYDSYIE